VFDSIEVSVLITPALGCARPYTERWPSTSATAGDGSPGWTVRA
jgi:hypothetical protein